MGHQVPQQGRHLDDSLAWSYSEAEEEERTEESLFCTRGHERGHGAIERPERDRRARGRRDWDRRDWDWRDRDRGDRDRCDRGRRDRDQRAIARSRADAWTAL